MLLGRFIPDTDVRFSYITPNGNSACVGISDVPELVFLRLCGTDLKEEREEKCIETKIVVNVEDYKD